MAHRVRKHGRTTGAGGKAGSGAVVTAAQGVAAGASRATVLDPIITMNSGGIIQSASASVEQVFGWKPDELFGQNVKVLIPEPRRTALDRYLDRYRRGDGAKSLRRTRRFEAVRKDGSLFQIDLSMSRAELPTDASPHFIGIIRDVSNQIDVGAGSSEEQTRLQQLITEQTCALATANLRLQFADRLASIGTLAAGLGHDIGNVLLPVRARLNALAHGGITPAALEHVTAVRHSVAYLQHLSEGLHFLALNPDGPSAKATTDLAVWWQQVGDLLRTAVPKRVKVTASFAEKLPPVMVAAHWLTQAMLNLIVNAGEAIPEKRKKGLVRITATCSQDGESVTLSVTDNGRGMPRDVQRRAFDLFFTTKSRGMGTGLGLALVRRVALRAGGQVELRSKAGVGTTAILTFPSATRMVADASVGDGVQATVTVKSHRLSALISQILIGAGCRVRAGRGGLPGRANLWVTEASARLLGGAERWRKGHARRVVVLVGRPSRAAKARWEVMGALVIDPPDDFGAMRDVLGQAIGLAVKRQQKEAMR